jgi:hypothetical protein
MNLIDSIRISHAKRFETKKKMGFLIGFGWEIQNPIKNSKIQTQIQNLIFFKSKNSVELTFIKENVFLKKLNSPDFLDFISGFPFKSNPKT